MTAGRELLSGAWLARLGFIDTAGSAATLAALGLAGPGAPHDDPDRLALVAELARAADPDLAVSALGRMAAASVDAGELLTALRTHPGLRSRLFAVLGASAALGEHLARQPDEWRTLADDAVVTTRPSAYGLRRTLLEVVGADPDERRPWGVEDACARDASAATVASLRLAYRRQQLLLAARDLVGGVLVDDVAAELADLAAAALEASLAVAAATLPAGSAAARLAVIGLGKCGGRELNYVSDVDVVFVAAPLDGGEDQAALRTATRLATGLIRICGESGPDGAMFAVDAGLRPEGRLGPLVRTLASHRAYYERWARTWEFQALLKARPVAGDLGVGTAYCEQIFPMVWSAAGRDSFVADVQAMRRQVERSVPAGEVDRQLKLGPGGLRDVEFAVQLLQLVHGRSDDRLRKAATLPALQALRDAGYVGRKDADRLASAYRWLRAVEHRLQLQRLRRTHSVPRDPAAHRWVARASGYVDVSSFEQARRAQSGQVRRLHEKLFYRPLLDAVARLAPDSARLSEEQARARLRALGYADPERAFAHLRALTAGVSRRADIQTTLLPVLLGWLADAADPDAGLLAFRQVSDALGATPWYLRLLRDEGVVAERFAKVLASGRYAPDLLSRAPEAMRLLADEATLLPRPRADVQAVLAATLDRSQSWEDSVVLARGVRRTELFRVACADLLGRLDVTAVGVALSDAAAVTVSAALWIAADKVATERRAPLPTRMAVIALGRLGGAEIGYGSDADVLFVHEPLPGADEQDASSAAHALAHETRRLLALAAPDPPLHLDAGLRPEGRQGPLVRTLASYAAYYARWASTWEAQALLRAAPLAGDAELTASFLARVVDPIRYPRDFGADQIREVRRLKARMEAERVSPARRARDVKLGPGGLSDVEWTIQLLQLRQAHAVPPLRVTGTLSALRAAGEAGLLSPPDEEALADAWMLASRVRNAVTLVTGDSSDLVPPTATRTLAGVARLLGYPPDASVSLLEDLRRLARRARTVTDRLFYGEST